MIQSHTILLGTVPAVLLLALQGCDAFVPTTSTPDAPQAVLVPEPPMDTEIVDIPFTPDGEPYEVDGDFFEGNRAYVLRGGPVRISGDVADDVSLVVESGSLEIGGTLGEGASIESELARAIRIADAGDFLTMIVPGADVHFDTLGNFSRVEANDISGGTAGYRASLIGNRATGSVDFLSVGADSYAGGGYITFSGEVRASSILDAAVLIAGRAGDPGDVGEQVVAKATESMELGDIGVHSTIRDASSLRANSIGLSTNVTISERITVLSSIGCDVNFLGSAPILLGGEPYDPAGDEPPRCSENDRALPRPGPSGLSGPTQPSSSGSHSDTAGT